MPARLNPDPPMIRVKGAGRRARTRAPAGAVRSGEREQRPAATVAAAGSRWHGATAGQGLEPQLPEPESGVLPITPPGNGQRPSIESRVQVNGGPGGPSAFQAGI